MYKDECLFVYMELIQIHISERIWTKLCTRLPLGLEETVGYVWTRNSLPLRHFGLFFFGGHCRIMGTRWLPARPFPSIPLYLWFQLVFAWLHRHDVADDGVIRASLISVIPAGVPLTSRKWRCSRRQSHPPQRRIPYSGGCSRYVTDITFNRATGAIRHSVISLVLAPVSVTYRKSRPCRWQLRVPTPSVLHCRQCVRYAGTWTGSVCLQFGSSSDGKEVTKELQLQLYK